MTLVVWPGSITLLPCSTLLGLDGASGGDSSSFGRATFFKATRNSGAEGLDGSGSALTGTGNGTLVFALLGSLYRFVTGLADVMSCLGSSLGSEDDDVTVLDFLGSLYSDVADLDDSDGFGRNEVTGELLAFFKGRLYSDCELLVAGTNDFNFGGVSEPAFRDGSA